MYRMAENNAKIKFTEVSLTAFISHCYSVVDIYFAHAFRIFTFFNEKHENLFMTRATETSLISEINFSMFLIQVAIVENIIKLRPNFLKSMQYQAAM